MKIIGVSFDSPEVNQAWAEDEGFLFDLWTDASKALALHYGGASSVSQRYADRVTVVLDATGGVVLTYESVSVGTHPREVLDDCRALWGQTTTR